MIKIERLTRTLTFLIFISFFLWSLSTLALGFSVNLSDLVYGTFLDNFGYFNEIILHSFFMFMSLVSKIIWIGGVIALLSIFIVDILINKETKSL